MKQRKYDSELHECMHKIESLLNEYNAKLVINEEIGLILYDKDTNKFVDINHVDEREK